MKPCRKNRKQIALLAVNELDQHEAVALREHIEACEGCRQYLDDILAVAEMAATAGPGVEVEPSEAFHRRVQHALKAHQSVPASEAAVLVWRSVRHWRMALTGLVAVVVLAAFAVLEFAPYHRVSAPAAPVAQPGTVANLPPNLAPTLANYEMAAGRSLRQLDELLTRQANQSLPPAPIYTASTPIAAADSE